MSGRRLRPRPAIWAGVVVFLLIVGTALAGEWGELAGTADRAADNTAPTATSEPAASAPTRDHTPTAAPKASPSAPSAGSALALLETIPVKGRAPKTGYDRPVVFGPAWKDVDRNGCDTRNDILRRDLTGISVKPGTHGCIILTGTLNDPYTGTVISFTRGQDTSAQVQIDHVVALMDAWQKGAQQLDQSQREALANDPLNLLAVQGRANQRKSAGDAATWLPAAKGFRCQYVARQISVKAKYTLWVTQAEHDAMSRVLQACPGEPVATSAGILPRETNNPVSSTRTSTPATTAPADTAPATVHPGAYCTPVGATGVSKTGKPMTCKTTPTDSRARWRAR